MIFFSQFLTWWTLWIFSFLMTNSTSTIFHRVLGMFVNRVCFFFSQGSRPAFTSTGYTRICMFRTEEEMIRNEMPFSWARLWTKHWPRIRTRRTRSSFTKLSSHRECKSALNLPLYFSQCRCICFFLFQSPLRVSLKAAAIFQSLLLQSVPHQEGIPPPAGEC